MDDERMSLADFIAAHGIKMTSRQVDRNPNMEDSGTMDHWRCTITCAGRRMVLTFSQGSGHHGNAPDLADILNCCASDSSALDETFDDWCSNLGYSTDSRKAHRIFRACVNQTTRLQKLLGTKEVYDQLIYGTERL